MNLFSLRTSTRLGATCVAAGLLAAAGCSSSSSSSSSAAASASAASSGASSSAASSSPSSASASPSASAVAAGTLSVKQVVLASTLKHSFKPNGKGAMKTESLSQPDDIVTLGGNVYVGFQNGVGSLGEPSTSGNTQSTLLEITRTGSVVKQWDVVGKMDGVGADAATGQVIVSVNEDSNSSMYSVSGGGAITHYTYSPALPSKGGSDGIIVMNGKILISGSAPGTSGKASPSAPVVYAITLNAGTKIATDAPFVLNNAKAVSASGGKKVSLALTDPDSVTAVPSSSPEFAGSFELTAQGDLQMIFTSPAGKDVRDLKLSNSVDDTAWATTATGALFATDSGANTVDSITGTFTPGTAYTAVTPCNNNSAPTVCPTTAYPANSLGIINLKTGKIGNATLLGPLTPKGLVFVP